MAGNPYSPGFQAHAAWSGHARIHLADSVALRLLIFQKRRPEANDQNESCSGNQPKAKRWGCHEDVR